MEILVKQVWFQQNLSPDLFAASEWRVDLETLSDPIEFMAFYVEDNLLGIAYRNSSKNWILEVGLEEAWSENLRKAMKVSEEEWNDILLLSVENDEAFEELEADLIANPERNEGDEEERFDLSSFQWLDEYESLTCAYMQTGYGDHEVLCGYSIDELMEHEAPTSLPVTEDQLKELHFDFFSEEDSMMSYPED
tara:strand:+ start:438 stop:1016 length:579 start_codon:yes stop_codon:yes gene_type:complete